MKQTILRYGRTFNLGNYESERIDLEREIEAGTEKQAIQDLALEIAELHLILREKKL